jgi:membrane protein implicated in regulation of membrane protease activity
LEWWGIWLIVCGVLLVAEMLTLTFYLLWIGVGAAAAALVAAIAPGAFVLQVLAGCFVAVLLTLFTKPLTRRLRASRGYRDAIDDLIGRRGIVLEEIDEGKNGIVKIGNETWSAQSNERLRKNDEVIVVGRGSAILEVQKWGGI